MSRQETAAAQHSREIPSRRIVVNSFDQLPGDYSTTPGGTLFSTTPGGTRLIYDRAFLLECRNSPLTKSPPVMAKIPGITEPGEVAVPKDTTHKIPEEKERAEHPEGDQPQFEMDI